MSIIHVSTAIVLLIAVSYLCLKFADIAVNKQGGQRLR